MGKIDFGQSGASLARAIQPLTLYRAQRGDPEAFNELILAFQDVVYRQALWLTGQERLAEDITQKAFLTASQKLPGFRGESFKAWILKIVTHLCYDEFRRENYPPMIPQGTPDNQDGRFHPIPKQIGSQEIPEPVCERHELISVLHSCFVKLSFEHRSVLILIDIQGLTYQEVSQVLGIPLGTVRSRISQARLQLGAALPAGMRRQVGT